MTGVIRLRSPGNDEDEECVSSESDVEEHLEVERRLDHDLSRFEMIYPNYGVVDQNSCVLENRVDDQDTHIAQLEEQNLRLKERLLFIKSEFSSLRSRLQSLETRRQDALDFMEEVVENDSENEASSALLEGNNVDSKEFDNGVKKLRGTEVLKGANVGEADVHMKHFVIEVNKIEDDDVNGVVAGFVNE